MECVDRQVLQCVGFLSAVRWRGNVFTQFLRCSGITDVFIFYMLNLKISENLDEL